MPLRLDYSFQDTAKAVHLTIPLKVDPRQVDITVTRNYIKVNQTPYLLQLDLADDVDFTASVVKVSQESRNITLELPKVTKSLWSTLLWSGTEEECRKRREAALAERVEHDKLRREHTVKRRQELSTDAVKQQMAVEDAARKRLETAEELAKKEAQARSLQTELFSALDSIGEKAAAPIPTDPKFIFERSEAVEQEDDSADALHYVPPPRAVEQGKQEIKFSQRVFPTPLRESKIAEEQSWLQRNAAGLKSAGKLKTASMASVMDAINKAEQSAKVGDYQSAANAYKVALSDSYADHATAVRFALCSVMAGHPKIAQEACIEVAKHENVNDVAALLHLIKAVSNAHLNDFTGAAHDAAEAINSAKLQSDKKLVDLAEAYADCFDLDVAVQAKKLQADSAVAANDTTKAIALYQDVLKQRPTNVPAHVNISTVYYKLGDKTSCLRLTKSALGILHMGPRTCSLLPTWSAPMSKTATSFSAGLKELRVKLLVKEATVATETGDDNRAITALKLAHQLSPADATITENLQQLEAKAQSAT